MKPLRKSGPAPLQLTEDQLEIMRAAVQACGFANGDEVNVTFSSNGIEKSVVVELTLPERLQAFYNGLIEIVQSSEPEEVFKANRAHLVRQLQDFLLDADAKDAACIAMGHAMAAAITSAETDEDTDEMSWNADSVAFMLQLFSVAKKDQKDITWGDLADIVFNAAQITSNAQEEGLEDYDAESYFMEGDEESESDAPVVEGATDDDGFESE